MTYTSGGGSRGGAGKGEKEEEEEGVWGQAQNGGIICVL